MDEEKIDELIEQKVEEKTKKLEKKVEKLEQEKRKLKQESETENKIGRRKFLKLAGLGAGGLAFSSLGTSWFSVNQNTGGGSSTLSEVLSNGNNVNNQNIVDNGTTIWNTNQQHIPATSIDETNLDADSIDGTDGGSIPVPTTDTMQINFDTSVASDTAEYSTALSHNQYNSFPFSLTINSDAVHKIQINAEAYNTENLNVKVRFYDDATGRRSSSEIGGQEGNYESINGMQMKMSDLTGTRTIKFEATEEGGASVGSPPAYIRNTTAYGNKTVKDL
jgi:hypothetical protein